jgi:hypothetical protein
MGTLIPDQNFLNDNIFLFEKRLGSQYTIFFDNKTPTFTTYYHINNINSITDTGFQNVEQIFGSDSPIRFQRIENFPIYGIESIVPDLNDDEEGLDVSFDSDAIILPNTIKPLPNDIFVIDYIGKKFMFMITEVKYDTIKSNNFYSIGYTLKNGGSIAEVEKQVLERYNCIFENIGTDDKCLIKSEDFDTIGELSAWYKKISRDYVMSFYNQRYNSFLFQSGSTSVYDRYLTHFINNNSLFSDPQSFNTIRLSNEDYDNTFLMEYEDCIYRMLEEKDIDSLDIVRTFQWAISYPDSIFKYYGVHCVRSIRFIKTGDVIYVPDELITNIKTNTVMDKNYILGNILIKYFNNSITSLNDIDIDGLKKYRLHHTFEDFVLLPMVLFCISKSIKSLMHSIDTDIE